MECGKKCWPGQIFFSHGTTNSKGVAILLHIDLKVDIDNVVIDPNGRYLIIEGCIAENNIALCNYYAPTSDKPCEQIELLDILQSLLSNVHHKLILAGDMNTWLQPTLDKYGNSKLTKTARKLNDILEQYDLIDIWRILNPETKRYTWRSKGKRGIQQSRLDYFLVANSFIYRVGKCEIGPSIYSDHNIISLEIKCKPNNVRGRGFWKFNTSLLRDKEYVDKINNIIDETIENHKEIKNYGLLWDTVKMRIRGASISYSSYKSKINKTFEKQLEKEREEIEIELAENARDETYERHANIKKELEIMHNERAKGMQIRAKCTHIELNEHSSKSFFSKEKAQSQTIFMPENG
jgi:exodeoxyribonuclease-3